MYVHCTCIGFLVWWCVERRRLIVLRHISSSRTASGEASTAWQKFLALRRELYAGSVSCLRDV